MTAGQHRARRTIRRLRAPRPAGTCQTGKVRWADEETARRVLARSILAGSDRRQEQRAYECRACSGGWHLTSLSRWTP